jgi:hypothetical protein
MGSGRWDNASTRASYAATSSIARTKSVHEVFKQRQTHDELNPRDVMLRESCDGEDNPNSNAVIIGLDVTGSMGHIAHSMAKDGLGTLIENILDKQPVVDPHIMFMAIGDAAYDRAPLQVSQFESDIRISQQLNQIYVEGSGGGNNTESYDLPWYFAGTRTSIDCFNKRGDKGYLFTVGDEMPPQGTTESDLRTHLGTCDQVSGFQKAEDSLALAQETYHVFHIIVEQGNYASRRLPQVTEAWQEMLGKRAISLNDHTKLAEVVVSVMQVSEGADVEQVIKAWDDESTRRAVSYALTGQ